MKLLPFEDFQIHTSLTPDEVFYRLRAIVETRKTWIGFPYKINKPYYGVVDRSEFNIFRVIWINERGSPRIIGKIQSENLGSLVRIKMMLRGSDLFFSLVFLVFPWFSFFFALSNLIIQKIEFEIRQTESLQLFLLPIGVFLFIYWLSIRTFKVEAIYSRKFLIKLLNANGEEVKYNDSVFGLTESQIIKSLFLVTFIASLGWILYSLLW